MKRKYNTPKINSEKLINNEEKHTRNNLYRLYHVTSDWFPEKHVKTKHNSRNESIYIIELKPQ